MQRQFKIKIVNIVIFDCQILVQHIMYSQDNDVEVHHDWTEARGLAQLEEYERDALPGNIMSL